MRQASTLALLTLVLSVAGSAQEPGSTPATAPKPLRFRSGPNKAALPATDLPMPPPLPSAVKLGWLKTDTGDVASTSGRVGSVLSLTPGASTAQMPGAAIPYASLVFSRAELVGGSVARFDGRSAGELLTFQFTPSDIGLYLVEFRLQPGARHTCRVTGPGGVTSSVELPATASSIPAVLDARERSSHAFTLSCSGGQWMFRSVEVSSVR